MMIGGGPGGQERPARLLLVDDDANLLVVLAEQLRDAATTSPPPRRHGGPRRLGSGWPDLVLLDMMMPRPRRASLAREIKARPTSRSSSSPRSTPPIRRPSSSTRWRRTTSPSRTTTRGSAPGSTGSCDGSAITCRAAGRPGPSLALELHRRTATVNGVEVALTPTESRLLYALAANLGQTVTTETLLLRGWADTDDADASYVWVTMRRLRTKIEPDPNHPRHLVTIRGVGYRLEPEMA